MVATTADAKKKYDAARTWVPAATVQLEEEQRTTVILVEEAHTVVALIEPHVPTPPSDDDYEAAVITNIHVQAVSV
jgi:hypothetical protein